MKHTQFQLELLQQSSKVKHHYLISGEKLFSKGIHYKKVEKKNIELIHGRMKALFYYQILETDFILHYSVIQNISKT